MIKTLSIVAAGCIFLLAGCRKAETKLTPDIPAVVEHAAEARTPYYYGLIEEYQRSLAEDPDNLSTVIALGNAFSGSGSWLDAIKQYEHAIRLDPHNADVHTDLGIAYRNIGLPYRAREEFRKAIEYEPGHLNARFNLGLLYAYDFRNYAVAIHIWDELLRFAPNHPQADFMRSGIVTFRKYIGKERQ